MKLGLAMTPGIGEGAWAECSPSLPLEQVEVTPRATLAGPTSARRPHQCSGRERSRNKQPGLSLMAICFTQPSPAIRSWGPKAQRGERACPLGAQELRAMV